MLHGLSFKFSEANIGSLLGRLEESDGDTVSRRTDIAEGRVHVLRMMRE